MEEAGHVDNAVVLTVDHRERPSGLVDALCQRWGRVAVATLPIGDVRVGERIVIERKTVHDFVVSVRDGRLFRQLFALRGECARPLLIIEGEDSVAASGMDAPAVRGVMLSILTGYGVPMLRTMGVEETAEWVVGCALREQRRIARGRREKRQAGPIEVLAAIPGVGEMRAQRLLSAHGSLEAVLARASVEELSAVPGIGPQLARRIHELSRGGVAE